MTAVPLPADDNNGRRPVDCSEAESAASDVRAVLDTVNDLVAAASAVSEPPPPPLPSSSSSEAESDSKPRAEMFGNRYFMSSDSCGVGNGPSSPYAVTGIAPPSGVSPHFRPPPPPALSHLRMSESTIAGFPHGVDAVADRNKRWSFAGTPELRYKVDTMQADLERLRLKNQEITNKYQSVLRDYESALESRTRLEETLAEQREVGDGLRQEVDMTAQEKQLLQQQIIDMRLKLDYKNEELVDLRAQLRGEARVQAGNSAAWIEDILKQWEDVRRDNDARRQECDHLREQIAVAEDRYRALHRQLDVTEDDRQAKDLKHHDEMVAMIAQLHKLAQERDVLRNRLDSVGQQLEDSRIEVTRLHGVRQRLEEKLEQMHCKYEAMHKDYDHTMHERSDVLEDNNRMTEERERLYESIRKLKSHCKALEEQNHTLQSQIGQLRNNKLDTSHYYSVVPVPEQPSLAGSETEIADLTHKALEKEVHELRQKLEHMRQEAEANKEESTKAMSKRDWALGERERTLSERDSIRTMCDQLRKERDDAISSLAKAIKDSDDLQRQREKAERELKLLRERADDPLLDNEQATSPSNSRDSAIDTDLAEWDVETLELSMAGTKDDLGIELRGGRDDPIVGSQVPIYVKSLTKGGKLDGHLRVFDCIMQVNDIDVSNMDHRAVMDILRNSKHVKMVIKRRRLVGMKLISVPLDQSVADTGLYFENGVYIGKIKTSSAAARAGNLAVGDRVVYVNDIPVHEKSAEEVAQLVKGLGSAGLVLAVMKSPPVLSPMTPSTSFPSQFASSSASAQNSARSFKLKTIDKQVQADVAGSDSAFASPHKSKANLLDKVHDKLFGKTDKKPRPVIAQATIESSVETLKSRHGSLRFSHRDDPRRSGSMRAPSLSSQSRKDSLEPDQVFRQFDEILKRESVDAPANRNLTKAAQAEKEAGGSTWPKSRDNPGVAAQDPMAASQRRKVTVRPSVFPVFPSPHQQQNESPDQQRSSVPASVCEPMPSPPSSGISSARSSQSPALHLQHQQRPVTWYPGAPHTPSGPSIYERMGSRNASRPNSAAPPPSNGAKKAPMYEDVFRAQGGMPAQLVTNHSMAAQMRIAHARPVPTTHSPPPGSPSLPKPPPYPGPRDSPDPESSLSQASSMSNPSLPRPHTPTRAKYGGGIRIMPPRISPFQPLEYSRRSSNGDPSLFIGKPRQICIDKGSSCESVQLGISIDSNGNGIFINAVSENSLAAKKGVQVGDQLLDICGLNMRTAEKEAAQHILRQVCYSRQHDQITMLLRYNPQMLQSDSAASTPRATPQSFTGPMYPMHAPRSLLSRESSLQSASTQHSREILASISESDLPSEPRWVYNLKRGGSNNDWGFSVCGGNACGVFVDGIDDMGPAANSTLSIGDMVLVFNGVNFRNLTLEQAVFELERKADNVNALVQYCERKYNRLKRGDGGDADSFYIRVNIDRPNENTDELDLKQGEIVYVDNTLFMGKAGRWRAWHLDQEGRQRQCGIIPSKYKLEEEFILKRSGSETYAGENGSEGGGSRRGTIRRSLKFIRRSSRSSQHHSRNASKDSGGNDDVVVLDELYQRVERLDYKRKRPLLIVGALVEPFVSRLVDEYPQVFAQCVPECPGITTREIEQGLQKGIFVDCRKRDKLFEVTTVAAVKDIVEKGYHCILDVGPSALERLQNLQIYPIVIRIKFKSAKQVKELKEQMSGERVGTKQAKEMVEKAEQVDLQLANINCQTTTVTAPQQHSAAHTVKLVCQQILAAVEHEQKKTLWILSADNI